MGSGGLIFFQMMILIKGVLIPGLLYMAVNRVAIKREIEPIIGYHASLFAGLIMILLSVFITDKLAILPARRPRPAADRRPSPPWRPAFF